MRVFEAIPELLRRQGTTHVFSMLGGTNVTWIAEGVRSDVFRLVSTRHEETCVHAATGYARATGHLGVCSTTRGPGFANAVNGLISATASHVPLLLIVGESPTPITRTSYTEQQVEQEGFAGLIGAGFTSVSRADELEGAFWEAVRNANWNGRPQVLSISNDIGKDELELSGDIPSFQRAGAVPDQEAVSAVADAVEESRRPVVLAGQGAVIADAHDVLVELADLVGARTTTTLRANRFFEGHPHDLGLCGTWSAPAVREVLASTDLVLAFGASLNIKTTYEDQIFGGAKIVHCEIDSNRPVRASAPELALLGDARVSAEALLAELAARAFLRREVEGGPSPTFEERKASVLAPDLGHDPTRGLDIRVSTALFDEQLPAERIIVTDSGRNAGITTSVTRAEGARSWLIGRGYGSVGLGLGTAIGAAVGRPDRQVVLFCGDGGFMMALAAMDVVRTAGISLTVVIQNDQQLGSEVKYLRSYGLPLDVVRQELPDVRVLAAAFGGQGFIVECEDDIRALDLGMDGGLRVIDVRLDPEVNGLSAFA